jgi:hypothetical protein
VSVIADHAQLDEPIPGQLISLLLVQKIASYLPMTVAFCHSGTGGHQWR